MRHRSLVLLAALLGAAACGEGAGAGAAGLLIEQPVLDIVAAVAAGDPSVTVLAQDEAMPLAAVPAAGLDKDLRLASDATDLVLHARAESAFEVRAGPFAPGAVLRARTMIFSQFRTDPERVDPVPVTFRILVDGVEQVALSSRYVHEQTGREHPFDRFMRALDVPLDAFAGRPITLRFEVTRGGARVPEGVVPADPVWWELLVVQPVQIARQQASPARPNLLVLVVDTLAARRMSLHGYARDTTPHLTRLARGGTLFTGAVSSSSWTLPAVASLLTGLPPNTHGVLGDSRSWLMDGLTTWPERLREQGLVGAAFVANALLARANNFDQGFEHWEQLNDAPAAALNARLLAWLDGRPRGERWFAWLHAMDPHAPYGAPGAERDRYAPAGYVESRDFGGFLPNQLQRGEIAPFDARARQHVVDLYDAEVAYLDRCVGELVAALEARGLLESTVIALTSDHGEELFEHGALGHGYSLDEELLSVPLLLFGPGIPAGVVDERPVSTAALASTLLALGGSSAIEGLPAPLFPIANAPREPVFSAVRTELFGPRRLLVSARDGEGRKVVLTLDEQGAESARSLRDLRSDPHEQAPLDAQSLPPDERAAFEALARAALAWHEQTAARRPPEPQPDNPEILEALRRVGYVGK